MRRHDAYNYYIWWSTVAYVFTCVGYLQPSSPGKRSKLEERSPKKFRDHGKMRDALTPPLLKQMKMKSAASVSPIHCNTFQEWSYADAINWNVKFFQKPSSSGEGTADELPPVELMKTSAIKNDTPNKFWASVEPYCAPFTDEDLKVQTILFSLCKNFPLLLCYKWITQFVEELIAAHHDDEEYLKIPPLGRHYSLRWAEDDLHQEQREGSRFGDKKKAATGPVGTDDAQRLLDTVSKNK